LGYLCSKKVECDPCAISSCEPNLVYESAFGHENRRRYSHFADLSSRRRYSHFADLSSRRRYSHFADFSSRRRYSHFADLSIFRSFFNGAEGGTLTSQIFQQSRRSLRRSFDLFTDLSIFFQQSRRRSCTLPRKKGIARHCRDREK